MTGAPCIDYRRCEVEETLDLRFRTLIVGTRRTSPNFDGDEDPNTRHYGAFEGSECVGCLRFNLNEWEAEPAWQLRGMAIEERFRGKRIGASLLEEAIADVLANHAVHRFWCNARETAVGFYVKQGWKVASDKFEVEGVGPHFKMTFEKIREKSDGGIATH